MEDGSQIALKQGESIQTSNAKSNGKEIIYEASNSSKSEVVYNYLTISRGGQYSLVLSDGTKVWLNSDTQLKYPVTFEKGINRKVELVYGEAYFDVSPSTANNGSKFVVANNAQEVEVIGTEFNIKAYKEESYVYTTLVEGRVIVNLKHSVQELMPNQHLSIDLKNGTTKVSEIDVFNEVSWKDGIFSFEEKSLVDIMKVLSRWYDVEVTFENESIKNEEFIGLLRKDQSLNKIISTIKDYGVIKNYEFNGNQLIIK